MNYVTIILIALPFISWAMPLHNELPQFKVTFISGCVDIRVSTIDVYIKGNKYFADHISPTYFDGQKIDSLWTIELKQEQIDACFKFLNKARSLPNRCERFTSLENHHIIVIGKDTMDINGDCFWDNLNFDFLDTQLFGIKHTELEERQKLFIATLNKDLSGKWYLQPTKKKLRRNDILTFSRSKVTSNFIVFGNHSTLTGNCYGLLKMKDLKRYKTELSDGWNETVVTFDWGKVTYTSEYNTWYEFGATFTLKNITSDELQLSFLWINNN